MVRHNDYGDNTCSDNPDREILHTILQRWVQMARKNNISYFLTTGTLLGAWRDGDIIPYDRDLDVLINSHDNNKLEKIKGKRNFKETENKFHLILQEDWEKPYSERRRYKCNGKLVSHYSDHCSFQEPLGRLIKGKHHLDIYDYKVVNGTIWDPSEWDKRFQLDDVFPLVACKFMGLNTFCPQKPVNVLQKFYGSNLSPTLICKNKKWIHVRNDTIIPHL